MSAAIPYITTALAVKTAYDANKARGEAKSMAASAQAQQALPPENHGLTLKLAACWAGIYRKVEKSISSLYFEYFMFKMQGCLNASPTIP